MCKSPHIVHGKGSYKGHELEKRVQLYKFLLGALEESEELKKIKIRIDPSKMIAEDYQEKAFMFFVERVNSLMQSLQSRALLIVDHDKDMVATNVTSLSSYKERGTKYCFGTEINHIVDTVHHTHSHHSRLIQMADVYTYTMALQPKRDLSYPRNKIFEYTKEHTNLFAPSKYKYWPTDQSWLAPQ